MPKISIYINMYIYIRNLYFTALEMNDNNIII